MWTDFFIACIVLVMFLFVPGFFFAKALKQDAIESVCYAPIITVLLYQVLSIVYSAAGVFSTWPIYFFPVLVLGIVCWVIRIVTTRGQHVRDDVSKRTRRKDWFILSAYVVCGIACIGYVFVRGLDGADASVQYFDNYFHLSAPINYVASGNWSPFYASVYNVADAYFDSSYSGGFYPASYTLLTAMLLQALALPITVIQNATNAVFTSTVFSCGMYVFIKSLFPESKTVLAFGALASFSIAKFPYSALSTCIFPNMAAACLLPVVLGLFIKTVDDALKKRKISLSAVVLVIVAACSVTLMHPSLLFTLVVGLTPFCIQRFFTCKLLSRAKALVASAVLLVIDAVFWVLMFKVPFMQSMLANTQGKGWSLTQNIGDFLNLSFTGGSAQLFVAAILIVGAVYMLLKRNNQWLIVSYLIFGACFVVAATFGPENPVKHFITGFWYGNHPRIAWYVSVFGMPLIAQGFAVIANGAFVQFGKRRFIEDSNRGKFGICMCSMIVFVAIIFCPAMDIRGFGFIRPAMYNIKHNLAQSYANDSDQKIYTPEEMEFVEEVKDIVGSTDVILNIPQDGSLFSYSMNGLPVLYRTFQGSSFDDAVIIRQSLNEIATNDEVREAVDSFNARYILLLDVGDYGEKNSLGYHYAYDNWKGIASIAEDTPGFKLVLEHGDMRLYEIEDAE